MSRVERIRVTNLLAKGTAKTCSIAHAWGKGFLVLQPRASLGSPSMFDMAAFVGLKRTAAQRTDIRIDQVDTVRSIAVKALHWKVNITPLEVPFCDLTGAGSNPFQGQRRTAAVTGALRDSQGTKCSILPFARCSLAVKARLAAIVVNHLRENFAPGDPKEAEPGTAGEFDSVVSRQSSYFSMATLTRAMDLVRPAPASQRPLKNCRVGCAWEACAGLSCPSISIRDSKSQEPESGQCGFLQAVSVIDDLRRGTPTCGLIGEVLAHVRQRWIHLLGKPVTPPLAGPDPDVIEGWGAAVEDWDAQCVLP